MSFTCGFYNSVDHDRMYNAVQFSQIFDGIINDGVYMGFLDHFIVTPSSGMKVQVGSGRAWFNHTWSYNDSPYIVSLGDSMMGLSRIDAVCLVIDISDEVRANSIEVIEGVPLNANPVKPELVNTATKFYHPLAYVTIRSEVTEIVAADIENAVGTEATPFVTGIIETISIDELVNQWAAEWDVWRDEHQNEYLDWIDAQENAFTAWATEQMTEYEVFVRSREQTFDSWIRNQENEFLAWFESIKGKLDGDVATKLTLAVEKLNERLDNDYYTKNDSDVRFDYNSEWIDIVLYADRWGENGEYSLEDIYPSGLYDITDILSREDTTAAERKAWGIANCGGYYEDNVLIAHGKKPKIDLYLKACVKEYTDKYKLESIFETPVNLVLTGNYIIKKMTSFKDNELIVKNPEESVEGFIDRRILTDDPESWLTIPSGDTYVSCKNGLSVRIETDGDYETKISVFKKKGGNI